MLDQTVALISLSLKRTSNGGFALRRKYQFEVSGNGTDRFAGYITVFGSRIVESRLEGPQGQNIFHQSGSSTLH